MREVEFERVRTRGGCHNLLNEIENELPVLREGAGQATLSERGTKKEVKIRPLIRLLGALEQTPKQLEQLFEGGFIVMPRKVFGD
jgi:hypothetical protein